MMREVLLVIKILTNTMLEIFSTIHDIVNEIGACHCPSVTGTLTCFSGTLCSFLLTCGSSGSNDHCSQYVYQVNPLDFDCVDLDYNKDLSDNFYDDEDILSRVVDIH